MKKESSSFKQNLSTIKSAMANRKVNHDFETIRDSVKELDEAGSSSEKPKKLVRF